MNETENDPGVQKFDLDGAPGDHPQGGNKLKNGARNYFIGLVLAALLTAISFSVPASGLIWAPALPFALMAFAMAQIGVHLVFFLHLTTGPDNTNNALALAFGVLIAFLLIVGSLWIMGHLNQNMLPVPNMSMF